MSAPMKAFGGRTFSFGTIPAAKAVRVEVALARAIGEPLFRAFTSSASKAAPRMPPTADEATGEEARLGIDDAAAAVAIGAITSKMDADELLATMGIVFQSVSCEGKPVDIDITFNGKNRELWQVFIEALKVNFADFLPGGLSASLAAWPIQK